jgi:hypothetical protein
MKTKKIVLFLSLLLNSGATIAREGSDHVGNGGGRFEVEVWRIFLQIPEMAKRCILENCSDSHLKSLESLAELRSKAPQLRFELGEALTFCTLQNNLTHSLPQENTIVFCSNRFYQTYPRPNSETLLTLLIEELSNFIEVSYALQVSKLLAPYLDSTLNEVQFEPSIFLWKRNLTNGEWTHAFWGQEQDLVSFHELVLSKDPCLRAHAKTKSIKISSVSMDGSQRQVAFKLHIKATCVTANNFDFVTSGLLWIYADRFNPKDLQLQWSGFNKP